MSLTLPPLSLYIHVPWCVRKCPYCDFNSHEAEQELPEAAYVDALLQDLEQDLALVQERAVSSVFIGGGTPSLLSSTAMQRLLDGCRQRLDISDTTEITMEANPGTFEQAKFAGFRQAGVNRLSVGVQSFQAKYLHGLGRIHSGDEAQLAIEQARLAGFDNLNIDLMHGLSGQTVDDALNDLTTAIALQPNHLSWYQLTIEQNTEFYSRPPLLPIDDVLADIQDAGHDLLLSEGFRHYEVSAYARPGKRSRHNLNYWQFGDYLAIGAGAHGKITHPQQGHIQRYWKTRLPAHYLDSHKAFTAGEKVVTDTALPFEFMMNALRLIDGVDAVDFIQRTGLPLSALQPIKQQLQDKSLLVDSTTRLQATSLGQRFLNEVLAEFME